MGSHVPPFQAVEIAKGHVARLRAQLPKGRPLAEIEAFLAIERRHACAEIDAALEAYDDAARSGTEGAMAFERYMLAAYRRFAVLTLARQLREMN